jgi:hypothetical protein
MANITIEKNIVSYNRDSLFVDDSTLSKEAVDALYKASRIDTSVIRYVPIANRPLKVFSYMFLIDIQKNIELESHLVMEPSHLWIQTTKLSEQEVKSFSWLSFLIIGIFFLLILTYTEKDASVHFTLGTLLFILIGVFIYCSPFWENSFPFLVLMVISILFKRWQIKKQKQV